MRAFAREAKQYGIVYTAIGNTNAKDGMCDLLVKMEDATRINRIVERFQLASIDAKALPMGLGESVKKNPSRSIFKKVEKIDMDSKKEKASVKEMIGKMREQREQGKDLGEQLEAVRSLIHEKRER